MKRKYYLKAGGSICYDKDGITFPTKQAIPFDKLANIFFGDRSGWQRQFNWENQPEVLIFQASETKAVMFQQVVNALSIPCGFIVKERDWA
jgi:hypothetical protein